MYIFVKFEMFNTITNETEILRIRRLVSEHMQGLLNSNKVTSQGVFADARGGYFILNLDNSDDLWSLLVPILDHFTVESRLLVSPEKLKDLLK